MCPNCINGVIDCGGAIMTCPFCQQYEIGLKANNRFSDKSGKTVVTPQQEAYLIELELAAARAASDGKHRASKSIFRVSSFLPHDPVLAVMVAIEEKFPSKYVKELQMIFGVRDVV